MAWRGKTSIILGQGGYSMRKILTIILLFFFPLFFPFHVFCQGDPFYPNDPYFFYSVAQKPYFPGQWHLENNAPAEITWAFPNQPDGPDWYKATYQGKSVVMKNTDIDTNVVTAWKSGFTGKGVIIGIVDDGVEGTNEDLAPNYSASLSRNFLGKNIYENQEPVYPKNNHGTAVAGVAAARGGNAIGGTGAAPYATIAGLRVLDPAATNQTFINAYLWKSGVESQSQGEATVLIPKAAPEIHINNHSYGFNSPFINQDEDVLPSLHATSVNGVIHVFASGNSRGQASEDANKALKNSYRDVINVAALGSDGKFTDYSCYGASIFVTAPSNRTDFYTDTTIPTGFGITTTDRTGKDLGYNAYSLNNGCEGCGDVFDSFPDYNYTGRFGGTSSAAPLVSGILALGKEANPEMDVRMVKHILVKTSDIVDTADNSATGKWLKNGAGNWFNPNYGFGNINAGKFVDMVQKVAYVTEQTSYSTGTQNVNEGIKNVKGGGTMRIFSLSKSELTDSIRQPLEGVEVLLNFSHPNRGNLAASMTSPSGMQSLLFNSTTHLPDGFRDTASVTNFEWTFLSNAFWGESGLGAWTINMVDQIGNQAGVWNSYNVTFLMGDILLSSDLPDTQQTDIRARSLTLTNSNKIYTIPAGRIFQARDTITVKTGSLVVNGNITEDAGGYGLSMMIERGVVSGNGSIYASRGILNDSGTILPGNSIGAINMTGDYAQGAQGKLYIEVASATSNDLLAITGKASLDGILETTWTGGSTPAINTKFGDILTSTAGVTGQFSSLFTNITPTVIFKPKYDLRDRVYLVVERDYNNSNLMTYLNANQQAVGSMLNSVGNSATGDLDTVLTTLDSLRSYDMVAHVLEQFAPKGAEAQRSLNLNIASFQTGIISERLRDLRRGSEGKILNGSFMADTNGDPIMLAGIHPDFTGMLPQVSADKWGVFVKGNAAYGNQKDVSGSTGYDFTTTGITIGVDYRFIKNLITGLILGQNSSWAHVDHWGSMVRAAGYSFGAYGSYYRKNVYIDAGLSYGLSRYDNTRRIVFPGIDRTAKSSPAGNQFTAYGEIGYDIQQSNWRIASNMSLQYVRMSTESYTESDAGALNLNVDRQSTGSLQGNVGVQTSYAIKTESATYLPHIRASYGNEFLKDGQNITSRLATGSSPFTIQTTSPDRNIFSVGAGLTVLTKKNLSLYIQYDAQVNLNQYIAHNANAGLRFVF